MSRFIIKHSILKIVFLFYFDLQKRRVSKPRYQKTSTKKLPSNPQSSINLLTPEGKIYKTFSYLILPYPKEIFFPSKIILIRFFIL
jgi:hypothetical protein